MNIDNLISAQINGHKAIRATLNGRVVWTPPASDPLLAFFSPSDSGLIADPSIDSRRFVTTLEAATANDGEPVGRVIDALSGGPGLSQPAAASRPAYSAGRGMLVYDGEDDFLDTGVERIGRTGLFADSSEQFCIALAFIVSPDFQGNDSIFSRAQGGHNRPCIFILSSLVGPCAGHLSGC